ncbi:hypothetical protein ACYULU_06755 [Breznakiellaceae bacterium SP9]
MTKSIKIATLTGFILSLLLLSGMLLISIHSGLRIFGDDAAQAGRESANFFRSVAEYDELWERNRESRNLNSFSQDLDDLDKQFYGAEYSASILKRRRNIAKLDSRYISGYRESAQAAAKNFPEDRSLTALAAEAIIMDPLTPDKSRGSLKEYLSFLSSGADTLIKRRFASLVLAINILEGNLKSAAQVRAVNIPWDILASVSLQIPLGQSKRRAEEQVLTDAAILKILDKKPNEAAVVINSVLEALPQVPQIIEAPGNTEFDPETETGLEPSEEQNLDMFRASIDFRKFASDFLYDFGSFARSAQLLESLTDDTSIMRRADAYYLSNDLTKARQDWGWIDTQNAPDPDILSRSRYNLAATADSKEAEKNFLEKMLQSNNPASAGTSTLDRNLIFGLIRYSRLIEDLADAIQELKNRAPPNNALVDLELLKRRLAITPSAKSIPETWQLLEWHPDDMDLYQWAAYYFEFQKQYTELAILLRQMEQRGKTEKDYPWMNLHQCFAAIRAEKLGEAEAILQKTALATWQVPANIARILEYQHSFREADANYQKALDVLELDPKKTKEDASLIYLRKSHVLRFLNKQEECRDALKLALQLNPKNVNARLELDRIDFSSNY